MKGGLNMNHGNIFIVCMFLIINLINCGNIERNPIPVFIDSFESGINEVWTQEGSGLSTQEGKAKEGSKSLYIKKTGSMSALAFSLFDNGHSSENKLYIEINFYDYQNDITYPGISELMFFTLVNSTWAMVGIGIVYDTPDGGTLNNYCLIDSINKTTNSDCTNGQCIMGARSAGWHKITIVKKTNSSNYTFTLDNKSVTIPDLPKAFDVFGLASGWRGGTVHSTQISTISSLPVNIDPVYIEY